jgi:hypothetical protein
MVGDADEKLISPYPRHYNVHYSRPAETGDLGTLDLANGTARPIWRTKLHHLRIAPHIDLLENA